jgi:hypothetical protein
MSTEILTIILGFLGTIFTIVSLNNQMRNEMHSLRTEMNQKFDKLEEKLEAEIKAVNTKLDTFLLALFKGSITIQSEKPENKDAA